MAKYYSNSSSELNSSFEVNSLESKCFHHNNGIINSLQPDDFFYLEKDLEFHDKVTKTILLSI